MADLLVVDNDARIAELKERLRRQKTGGLVLIADALVETAAEEQHVAAALSEFGCRFRCTRPACLQLGISFWKRDQFVYQKKGKAVQQQSSSSRQT